MEEYYYLTLNIAEGWYFLKYLPYKIFLLSLLAVGLFVSPGLAAEPEYFFQVQPGSPLPEQGAVLFGGQADLTGDGRAKWVFANDNAVRIYDRADDGAFQLWEEVTFEAAVSALKLADLDGDGIYEVIVAYDDIGILDVIGWSAGEFWKSYTRVYLWSKVASLDSLKISGFPFRLILAITEDGSLSIFRWNGVHPETLWTSNHLKGSQLYYIGSGDFDLDGESDFALVVNRAELQIYSPGKAQLKPVWTNFPWGGISSSYLVDLDNDRAEELVVASPAGLLYAFEWYRGSYIEKWKYEEVPGIIQQLTYLVLPQSQRPALAGEIRGTLLIWPLSRSGAPQPHATVKVKQSGWQLFTPAEPSLLAWDAQGIALRLVEYRPDELRIYFNQSGLSFRKLEFLIHRGEIWIPLRQMASLFGMSLNFDPISGFAYLSTETVFIVLNDVDQIAYFNGVPVKLPGGLKKINGIFSLSLPLAESMFNFTTYWLKETAYLFPN